MRFHRNIVFVLTATFAMPHVSVAGTTEDDMSSMSIVGFDSETGDVGIALASNFFAVGPIAAHARADVGAVATWD